MEKESKERKIKTITSNRKAFYDFEIINKMEVGIALQGTEVKSLRNGKCSLQESYLSFEKNTDELYIINMNIPEYAFGNISNHEPKRKRKILLKKHEAIRWHNMVNEKGLTMVPLEIYFSGHLVKLEIALVRPKKKFDKREATKSREINRELQRNFKT